MQSLIKVIYTRMIAVFCLLSMSYFEVQSQTDFKTKTEVLAYLVSRKTFINEKENILMNFSEMGNKVSIGTEKYSNPKVTVVSSSVAILEYQSFTNVQVKISLIVDARENSIMNRKNEKIFKSILTIPDQTSSIPQPVQTPQQPIQTSSTPAASPQLGGAEEDNRKGSGGWPFCVDWNVKRTCYLLKSTKTGNFIGFGKTEDIALKNKEEHNFKDFIEIVKEQVVALPINCDFDGSNPQMSGTCTIVYLKDGTYLTNAQDAKRGKYTCGKNGKKNIITTDEKPLTESKTKPLNLTPSLKNLVIEQNNILYAKLD